MLSALTRCLTLAPAVLLLAAVNARGETSIKVSLSRDDPDVQQLDQPLEDLLEFYLFVDGQRTVGAEFGVEVTGGEFLAYVQDTGHFWLTVPSQSGPPKTIGQAHGECLDPPVYLGKILVKPGSPEERVTVDVVPADRDQDALVIYCDLTPGNGFRAYPASVNAGENPLVTHMVWGIRGDRPPDAEDGSDEKRVSEPDSIRDEADREKVPSPDAADSSDDE